MFRELRTTLLLALPIAAGHLGQILLGVTDSLMIGRLGPVPLAASAFAGTFFSLVYVTAIGLLTAVSVRTAHAHGAARPREAGEVLRHGLFLAAVLSVGLGAVIQAVSHHLARFGQPPEVAAAAPAFLTLIGWSLVPGLLFTAVKNACEALDRPWTPLLWVLAGVGLNVLLNWILIYGHLGFPALGLAGSGWATLLSRTALFAGLALHLHRSRALAAARPARWFGPLVRVELRAQLRLGLPVSAQLLFEVGLFSIAGLFMGWFGTVPLAAHQIALSCASTAFMCPLAIAVALSIRLGRMRGAGEPHRLRTIGLGGIGAGAAIMGVFAGVFITLGRPIAALFIADPAVIALAARLLVVAAVFQLFDGTQVTASGALRGLADVRWPTAITFAGYWLLALPAAWIAGFKLHFGPVGVWAGLALGLAACALLLLQRFLRKTGTAAGTPD